jgi:hypothetical protein
VRVAASVSYVAGGLKSQIHLKKKMSAPEFKNLLLQMFPHGTAGDGNGVKDALFAT